MASTAQLGEKMLLEQHQYPLWQELWEKASQPALWVLEKRVVMQDKSPVIDELTGYVISCVSDNPITLEVIPPSSPPKGAPSPMVSRLVPHFCANIL